MKDFKDLTEARRSINFFDKTKKLNKEKLKKIIDMAVNAPSSFNLQAWKILEIRSDEAKEKLYTAAKQDKILEAPVILVILGDKDGFKRKNPIWNEKIKNGSLDEEKINGIIQYSENILFPNEIKKTAFAVRNSSLLAMSIMYSAKYYDVESHAMIGFDEAKVKEIFNISENYTVTMLLALGYFDESKTLFPREKRFVYEEISTEY